MRFTRSCLFAAFAMLAMANVAQATPISFSDTFNPANVRFDNIGGSGANCLGNNVLDTVSGQIGGECETLEYTHVLQAVLPHSGPFNPATDSLTSANLALYVYDDETGESAAEKLDFTLDFGDPGSLFGSFPAVSLNSNTSEAGALLHNISLGVIALLENDGTLVVKLSLKSGDLFFHQSILTAQGDRVEEEVSIPTVPEPGTLALLGFAAVAAGLRRKSVI